MPEPTTSAEHSFDFAKIRDATQELLNTLRLHAPIDGEPSRFGDEDHEEHSEAAYEASCAISHAVKEVFKLVNPSRYPNPSTSATPDFTDPHYDIHQALTSLSRNERATLSGLAELLQVLDLSLGYAGSTSFTPPISVNGWKPGRCKPIPNDTLFRLEKVIPLLGEVIRHSQPRSNADHEDIEPLPTSERLSRLCQIEESLRRLADRIEGEVQFSGWPRKAVIATGQHLQQAFKLGALPGVFNSEEMQKALQTPDAKSDSRGGLPGRTDDRDIGVVSAFQGLLPRLGFHTVQAERSDRFKILDDIRRFADLIHRDLEHEIPSAGADEEPAQGILPAVEWFDLPNLPLEKRFYAIESVARRLIDDFPKALSQYRAACDNITAFRSAGVNSNTINNQQVFANVASEQLRKYERWLRILADQATAFLPELKLPVITQHPSHLDSSEQQEPVLNELEAIKKRAIQERVNAERDAASNNNSSTVRKLVTIHQVAKRIFHLAMSSMTPFVRDWGKPVIKYARGRKAKYDLDVILPTLKAQVKKRDQVVADDAWKALEADATAS